MEKLSCSEVKSFARSHNRALPLQGALGLKGGPPTAPQTGAHEAKHEETNMTGFDFFF